MAVFVNFINGWLALAALPAIAVPVVIHLFWSRRHRRCDWAAMQFLRSAVMRTRRRSLLENILLMVLRCIVVGAVALALARPVLREPAAGGEAVLLIVDNSLPMTCCRSDGENLLQAARKFVRKRLLPAKGIAAVVTTVPLSPRLAGLWLSRRELLLSALQEVRPSAGRPDWRRAIKRAVELIDDCPLPKRRRTCLILTADARGCLEPLAETEGPLQKLRRRVGQLVLVNFVTDGCANVSISDLQVERLCGFIDLPRRVTVKVVNYSAEPAEAGRLVVLVDGLEVSEKRIGRLNPGQQFLAETEVRLSEVGQHLIEARLVGCNDSIMPDNSRWLVLARRKALRVLLVEPTVEAGSRGRTGMYVLAALQALAGEQYASRLRIRKVDVPNLEEALADGADVTVLCEAGMLPEGAWQMLAQRVRGGMGLIVWMGPAWRMMGGSAVERIAELLGGLPADIVQAAGAGWRFRLLKPVHPAFEMLSGWPDTSLYAARIWKALRVRPTGGAQVVAYFEPAHVPAVLLKRTGRGVTAVITTSATLQWNNMPAKGDFVPFVAALLSSVVPADYGRCWISGRPLVAAVEGLRAGEPLEWIRPDGASEVLEAALRQGQVVAELGDTDLPGVYLLRAGAGQRLFAVNADAGASDTRPAGPQLLERLRRAGCAVVRSDEADLKTVAAGSFVRREVAGAVATVAFLALLLETVAAGLSDRFRGVRTE